MADEIKIELIADANGVVRSVKQVEGQAKKSGKKAASNIEKPLRASAKGIGNAYKLAFAGVAAAAGAALASKKFIEAAIIQEQSVHKLNTALKNNGMFTEQTSNQLQNFASQLQASSTIGDEASINMLAYAVSLGATADQAKTIVKAAAEMSSALDSISFESATEQIARTLSGSAGRLAMYGINLDGVTKKQLQAGEAATKIANQFAGFALAKTKTFGGALEQLGNTYGDLFEKIGFIIVKNPVFIKAINFSTKALTEFINSFSTKKASDFLGNLVIGFVDIARVIADVMPAVKFFFNIFKLGFNVVSVGIQGFIRNIAFVADKMIGLATMVPGLVSQETVNAVSAFRESSQEQMDQMTNDMSESMNNLFNVESPLSQNILSFANRAKEALTSTTEEVNNSTSDNVNKTVKSLDKFSIKTQKVTADFSKNMNAALVKGTSLAVQHFTNGLLRGEVGFKEFGQAVAGMLGDMSIQMGETLIASGIGIEALKSLGGAAAIAAGVGLIALGTILKSFSGGKGGAQGSGAGGAPVEAAGSDTVGGPIETLVEDEDDEPTAIEKQQQVQLVVQGDVLDSEETGTRLLNILNEEFDSKGGRIAYA